MRGVGGVPNDPGKAAAARLRKMAGPEMVRQVGAALKAGAGIIEVEAAISITNGATSGKGHVVSAPGQPPNADTHDLDRSITSALVEPLKAEVVASSRHAKPLEYGTSKMAARPFFKPAAEKHRQEVRDLIGRALNKIVKGGSVVP